MLKIGIWAEIGVSDCGFQVWGEVSAASTVVSSSLPRQGHLELRAAWSLDRVSCNLREGLTERQTLKPQNKALLPGLPMMLQEQVVKGRAPSP